MGAQTIKGDVRRRDNKTRIREAIAKDKLLRDVRDHGNLMTVSIVQDINTGKIYSVGLNHAAAVNHSEAENGTWEVKEYQVWR